MRKPVIAACNGHAVGAGLGMAMQTDIRVLADEGKYGFLQSRRGVVTDFAMEYLLPRLVGMERALELLMRGQRLSGSEAVTWGLAGRSACGSSIGNSIGYRAGYGGERSPAGHGNAQAFGLAGDGYELCRVSPQGDQGA